MKLKQTTTPTKIELQAMATIAKTAYPFPRYRWNLRDYEKRVDGTNIFILARKGNGILGEAVVNPKHSKHAAFLEDIQVRKDAQGKGIGKALLHAAERATKKARKKYLQLDTFQRNRRAIAFYTLQGFNITGLMETDTRVSEAGLRIIMQKEL